MTKGLPQTHRTYRFSERRCRVSNRLQSLPIDTALHRSDQTSSAIADIVATVLKRRISSRLVNETASETCRRLERTVAQQQFIKTVSRTTDLKANERQMALRERIAYLGIRLIFAGITRFHYRRVCDVTRRHISHALLKEASLIRDILSN
jgi:hypothetical protein